MLWRSVQWGMIGSHLRSSGNRRTRWGVAYQIADAARLGSIGPFGRVAGAYLLHGALHNCSR